MGRSYYQQLSVAPLGREATREMINGLLGYDPSVVELGELIRGRTQGNPFFIEEVVQALAASGALAGERGAYRWTRSAADLEVPATVQALLAARVDGLAENDKLVLQTAAVIGKRFSERVLRHIVGLPTGEVDGSLGTLERAEFIHGETETEYVFRHPLTQEVAYGSQLLERRVALHAAVARALEAVFADRLGERAALIAHHWEQARRPAQAARWRRLAALRWARIGRSAARLASARGDRGDRAPKSAHGGGGLHAADRGGADVCRGLEQARHRPIPGKGLLRRDRRLPRDARAQPEPFRGAFGSGPLPPGARSVP